MDKLLNALQKTSSLNVLQNHLSDLSKNETPTETRTPSQSLKRKMAENYTDSKQKLQSKWTPQTNSIKYADSVDLTSPNLFTMEKVVSKEIDELKPKDAFETIALSTSILKSTEYDNTLIDHLGNNESVEDQKTAQIARLKHLLLREQIRNKRIKKIKSKQYHKISNKKDERDRVKILEKMEKSDPLLAQSIRQDYEKKLAHLRLNRSKAARTKWAKLANRFGSKEYRSVVSSTAQRAHDDFKRISDFVKTGGEGGEDDDDLIEDDGQVVSSNLHNLKFMKAAEDRQRMENDNLLKDDYEGLEEENGEEFESSTTKSTGDSKLVKNLLDLSNVIESPSVPLSTTTHDNIWITNAQKNKLVSNDQNVDDQKFHKNSNEKSNTHEKSDNTSENNSEKNLLADLFEDVVDSFPSESIDNNKVTSEPKIKNLDSDELPGWGSWVNDRDLQNTSHHVNNITPNIKHQKDVDRRKRVNQKNLPDKYIANSVPFPFENQSQYEAVIENGIGSEWNSSASYTRMITPKINAKLGHVIAPLTHAKVEIKNNSFANAKSIVDAWTGPKKATDRSGRKAKF